MPCACSQIGFGLPGVSVPVLRTGLAFLMYMAQHVYCVFESFGIWYLSGIELGRLEETMKRAAW